MKFHVWIFCRLCDLNNECKQLEKDQQHFLMKQEEEKGQELGLVNQTGKLKIENELLEKNVEEDKATKTRKDWKTNGGYSANMLHFTSEPYFCTIFFFNATLFVINMSEISLSIK